MSDQASGAVRGFCQRLLALTRKETRQLLRDRSNLTIGLALPALLILLFGYGISLDVNHVSIAVVIEDASPGARDTIAGLRLSRYFTQKDVYSMRTAETLMEAHAVQAILRVPGDFSGSLASGQGRLQLIVNGSDATTARIIEGYVQSALARGSGPINKPTLRAATSTALPSGTVRLEERLWFNEANTSTWYLVPGLIVLIMTLVGTFLTSMVVAREWERGTLEALFVTPVRPTEILLAKTIPYFVVGMIGFAMTIAAARLLFHVPMLGSAALLLFASVLYLLASLGMGLWISALTKNQFIASQTALLTSFMPALMLSGFLFDLNNVPVVVRFIGELLPATHFLELIKTLMLAGTIKSIVLTDCAILIGYAVLFIGLARLATRKRLA